MRRSYLSPHSRTEVARMSDGKHEAMDVYKKFENRCIKGSDL